MLRGIQPQLSLQYFYVPSHPAPPLHPSLCPLWSGFHVNSSADRALTPTFCSSVMISLHLSCKSEILFHWFPGHLTLLVFSYMIFPLSHYTSWVSLSVPELVVTRDAALGPVLTLHSVPWQSLLTCFPSLAAGLMRPAFYTSIQSCSWFGAYISSCLFAYFLRSPGFCLCYLDKIWLCSQIGIGKGAGMLGYILLNFEILA